MHLHQFLHQREADSAPLMAPAPSAVDAPEALEKVGQIALGNAGPGIRDGELHMVVLGTDRHPDLAVESGFQGVGNKVENDLLPHVAVHIDRLGKRRAIHLKLESAPLHG